MSARDDVSEIFDSAAWQPVDGFDFSDITYHRAVDAGVVRIAFDRPEVRNAFRPQSVDELITALEHARLSTDVGCVLLTGNGPSEKNAKWAFCSGGDQRIRGRTGYQYAEGETADSVDKAALGRLHILECQRLIRFMPKIVICLVPGWTAGGGHSLHVVCDLTIASREQARFWSRSRRPVSTGPTSSSASAPIRRRRDTRRSRAWRSRVRWWRPVLVSRAGVWATKCAHW